MRKHLPLFLFFSLFLGGLFAQHEQHSTEHKGVQTFENATSTIPFKSGTTPPVSCTANKEYFTDTDKVGCKLLICNGTGNGWVDSCGTGVSDHAALDHLDFADSGHTHFADDSHAADHLEGGSDPLTTTTPTEDGVPQADSSGLLDPDWLADMTGGGPSTSGLRGLVPTPGTGPATDCLRRDGTFGDCGGSGTTISEKAALLTSDGSSNAELSVGSTGTVLTPDSSTDTGLKWGVIGIPFEQQFPTTSRFGSTCQIGTGINAVASTSSGPTACYTPTTTAPYSWSHLQFGDDATRCINISPLVPQAWNGGTVSVSLVWLRQTGTGTTARWTVESAFLGDDADYTSPTFNIADVIEAAVPSTTDHRKVSTISNLNMTSASALSDMLLRVCRTPTHTNDNYVGSIGLVKVVVRWILKPSVD